MAELPAIIFDLDGTLIDSAPDIHATANKVFLGKGLQPFPFEVVRGFIGNGVGVLVSRLLQSQGLDGAGPLQAELVASFVKLYEEAFDLTVLYPGVLEALEALAAQGHPMGICTNKPEAPARAALRHFGLDRHMRILIGGDSLAQRKPDPAPLQAAIAALGNGPALFVGDSEVDAETAQAAGIALALFTEGYRKAPVEVLGAKLVFNDFRALPGLVSHLSVRL
ncbi:phosphoglycolate phosphatase [Tabrizicola sp.]|uniref:phosphoglycolate phosphatase n=1 Tax=Tabrizicola sp. TaxID=2005166 RepID=UPI0026230EBD|nr:phosphoglycolate phosphatase [Tabrizicola sp.]MDM7931014.1 phosphoglycolate phosphatase [Tabrizicola sp.]